MPTLSVTLPTLHPKQREIALHPARFRIIAAGRRWGKSRLGAALVVEAALAGGAAWWVAPTYPMSRVGWRLLSLLCAQIPGAIKHESERTIQVPGGGWLQVRSADDPDALRGEGLNFVVLDEAAFLRQETWTEALRPALSDRQGRALFLSTPKGGNWFHTLYLRGVTGSDAYDPAYASWNLPTAANPYIAPEEITAAQQDLTTRVFRQEYQADFLGDPIGALWKRDWFQYGAAPDLQRVVVAIDPAGGGPGGDETGIIVCGKGVDGRGYVLADRSCRLSPDGWALRAIAAFDEFSADRIVAETNFGGGMVESLMRAYRPALPFTAVHASRGKAVRAEPVAALYQQQRVTHCESLPELEDQLCQWEQASVTSPDRLDALCWGMSFLMLAPEKPRLRAF